MNNRGVVYILLSQEMMKRSKHKADAPYMIRVLGKALSYIGTGLDAEMDYDGDGMADIVVGADVDHEAGFGAGAVYYLSGGKIVARHHLMQ